MIAGIRGRLENCRADGVVVRVGGISVLIQAPALTLDKLGPLGSEVQFHTHLYVREDNIVLYGFSTPEELAMFQMMIAVTGVGPRTALSLLSIYPP